MNPRDIRSLDIGMLRTFDALMRERSVSRAARPIGLALSQQHSLRRYLSFRDRLRRFKDISTPVRRSTMS